METKIGELFKSEDWYGWFVLHVDERGETYYYQLHPDDSNNIMDRKLNRMDPIVEFNLIEYQKMDGVARYAKLKTSTK